MSLLRITGSAQNKTNAAMMRFGGLFHRGCRINKKIRVFFWKTLKGTFWVKFDFTSAGLKNMLKIRLIPFFHRI
jgi:hypothetical protein